MDPSYKITKLVTKLVSYKITKLQITKLLKNWKQSYTIQMVYESKNGSICVWENCERVMLHNSKIRECLLY